MVDGNEDQDVRRGRSAEARLDADPRVLRTMTADDVAAVIDVQEPGAIRCLTNVFPQDAYPFPRSVVAERWRREIVSPEIDCFVVPIESSIAGFAAIRGDEFLHFGIAVEHWGGGLARAAHDAVLDVMRGRDVRLAWLRAFIANGRGRRFYEKLGWRQTGERTHSSFPPYAELLRYERRLTET